MRGNRAWRGRGRCIAIASATLCFCIVAAADDPPEPRLVDTPQTLHDAPGNPPADAPPAESPDFRSAPIYSNSGNLSDPFLVTRPLAGCGNLAVSDLQTALGLNALGFNCLASSAIAVADDFSVPSGQTWTIDQLVLYLYQTDIPVPSITGVNLRFQNTNPLGQTVPALASYVPAATWSAVYKNKDTDAPGTECTRRIQQCVITLATPYVATEGMHYVIWQANGTGSSGPWVAPVVIPGAINKPGANALQAAPASGGLFVAITDSGAAHAPQDLVFVLRGAVASALPGDVNCDGVLSFADINPFVLALQGQAAYEFQFPSCRWLNADVNGDGVVSFADINPFVALLSGAPAAHPGDMNCDAVVSFADINPFVLALSSQSAYESAYPTCRFLNADVNGDGVVSFADINGFVALLSGP